MTARRVWFWPALGALLVAAVACAFVVGPAAGPDQARAVLGLRAARVALGILAGAVLGLVGAGLQGLLQNPLADPFTLGVASGAAFGSVLARMLGGNALALGPLGGIVGALVTMFGVWWLSRVRGRVTVTGLVLAGVTVSFLFSSLTMLAMILGRRTLGEAVYAVMGHLGVIFTQQTIWYLAAAAVIAAAGSGVLLAHARVLDVLSTGEETARSLGIDSRRTMLVLFVTSSVLVGTVVALVGAVSFIGLIVPHMVRLWAGPKHGRVMPGSMVLGAALLLFSDSAARSIVPGGLPLSVVTALVGVPFFIYLLRRGL